MKIRVEKDASAVGVAGADLVSSIVATKPDLSIVPATGNSPMQLYACLAVLRTAQRFDARRATVFQLDAYAGISDSDERSLYRWMDQSFLRPLEIPDKQVVRFDEQADDLQQACAAYRRKVEEAGGFDLAILGLGPNGHLGFNEPPSTAESSTRVITLSDASIESNARYWGGPEKVPVMALTAGMDILLAAKTILLVVTGAGKHDILRRTVEGPVTPDNPASFLQRCENAIIMADAAAWHGRDETA